MRYLALVAACLLAATCFAADEPRKFTSGGRSTLDEGQPISAWVEQALKARAAGNRNAATSTLHSIAGARDLSDDERKELVSACSKILKGPFTDDTASSRTNIISAAGRLKEATLVPDVTMHLRTSPEYAIRALVEIGDSKACPALLKHAQDIKASYRGLAVEAVGHIGTQEEFKTLEKMHDRERDANMKEAIGRALDLLEKRLKEKT